LDPSSTALDVSVIVPTFRREKLVVEAVQSALQQEGVSLEVLVLDDSPEGSARAAVTALNDPRVRYIQREVPSGGKPALVRNEGFQKAKGRYVYCLDDDDHVLPGGLRAMVSALDAEPDKGVAFGRVQAFGENEEIVERYRRWWNWAATAARMLSTSSWLTVGAILFRGTLIINSTCMIRRSCLEKLGGYDGSIPVYEDVEFFMRGIRKFGHVFVDYPVLHYRTGAPSLIHNLKGDKTPIAESYRIIHKKYRAEHGRREYAALWLVSRLLPLRPAPPR
jgi:glycosyltransferase involved in cell wall biosynthesis